MKILKNTAIAFLFFGVVFAFGYFDRTNAKSLVEYETKTPQILSIENKTVVTGKFLRMRLRLNLKYLVLLKTFCHEEGDLVSKRRPSSQGKVVPNEQVPQFRKR